MLQIFAQRPKDHGLCIHINAIQLHLMIFPKSDNGWDDLLKSTKEVSLVKPLNRSKPNHIVVYNHTDLGMFGIDMGAQEFDRCNDIFSVQSLMCTTFLMSSISSIWGEICLCFNSVVHY